MLEGSRAEAIIAIFLSYSLLPALFMPESQRMQEFMLNRSRAVASNAESESLIASAGSAYAGTATASFSDPNTVSITARSGTNGQATAASIHLRRYNLIITFTAHS